MREVIGMIWLSYAITWVATAAAIAVGIQATGHWWLLFFLLLPAGISIHAENK